MKTIDGSRGEGGGQVVRTTMALAIVTGTPVRIENIRAGRKSPGLMRQHLTSVQAAAAVCGGELHGAELRSTAIEFVPGEVRGGEYEFAVGTAGSVALVLQTILPALIHGRCDARITIEGGTHAKMAPPYEFLHHAYARAVRALGSGFELELELEQYGFFPAGGGKIVCYIDASGAQPARLDLRDERPFRSLHAFATSCDVPVHVAERELATLREAIAEVELEQHFDSVRCASRSPGNTLHVRLEGPNATEVFTAFGEPGVSAERLGGKLADDVRKFLRAEVPVGPHLADQLLVLLSVAGGGVFHTVELTLHSRTLLDLIPEFLDVRFDVIERAGGTVEVEVLQ